MNVLRVFVIVALVGCVTAPATPTPEASASVPFRLPAAVRPTAYRLAMEVAPHEPRFSGSVEIDLQLPEAQRVVYLHARGMAFHRALLRAGGTEQSAAVEVLNADGMATITVAQPVGPGLVTAHIEYDAPFGERNDGLYRVQVDADAYAVTQFEASTARMAFPCLDEPGFKAPLDLELTVPTGQVAASNMPIQSRVASRPGFERVRFQVTPPLPTYLYAWVVGPFDVVEAPALAANATRPYPLPLRGLAPRGHGADLADSLHFAAPSLVALENYFGSAFPYPKVDFVAIPDFGAGAMENAGLITFRDALLLYREDTAPVQIRKDEEITLAHELAHQWFGDLVTLAWWDDLWLNESFAEWLNYPIAQQVRPEFKYPLEQIAESSAAMTIDGLVSARQIRQPVESPGDIQNAFDGITYSKGQSVVRMFERFLGPEAFQAGVRRYVAAHANSTATATDLMKALGEASGKDVATPFRTFTDQPGVPLVDVQLDCTSSKPRLHLRQQRYLPLGSAGERHALWLIPFCAEYPGAAGNAVACTLLTTEEGTLELAVETCPAWVHPNPQEAGYYRWSMPTAQLAALAAAPLSDPDRLALASNLEAAESAGAVPFADALAALAPLVANPEPTIGEPPMTLLFLAEDCLADEAWRSRVHAAEVALYAPVLAETGLLSRGSEEDPRVAARRAMAAKTLAISAEDPPTRRALAERGRAYLPDLLGAAHPEAVDPGVAGLALSESLRSDPSRLEGVIGRLASEQDPTVREVLLLALEGQQSDAAAARVREVLLDARLRTSEVFPLLVQQMTDRHTREAAWAWLVQHLGEFTQRLDEETRADLPELGSGFCSDGDVVRIEGLLQPHLGEMPGADRTLRQVLERVHLCAAHAAAQRASAKAYFQSR